MKRDTFLRATAGSMAVAALPRLSASALAVDVVNVTLLSAPRAGGLAFNGTIPGPLLRVVHGQRIRVRYVSGVNVPTSIHWHGMLVPNAMDGVAGVTQRSVRRGETFVYEFTPGPPGTRWYHDHAFGFASARGLFGMFVVDDPREEPADREYALVFHDVPDWRSFGAALRGVSSTPMIEPMGAPAMRSNARMGDEVAYAAYCINGASYPHSPKYPVRVGERVRLRILNASPTRTHYVALAGQELLVTHVDGNALEQPVVVNALRVGTGERYDVSVTFRMPGAFLLQGISSDSSEMRQQAVLFYTEGMEDAPAHAAPAMLDGLRVATYETIAGVVAETLTQTEPAAREFVLGGGGWGNPRWTIDDRIWPHTPKLVVRKGDRITVRFRNAGDMEHPMHLHGHLFELTEVNGTRLMRPLRKDGALVGPRSTATWRFVADAPPGRWMLHCHNEIHMNGGMMTEIVYRG